jgi:DNA polymerase-1
MEIKRIALDLETAPNTGDLSNGYALEPWRARQGLAHISSIAVIGPGRMIQVERPSANQLIEILMTLKDQEVWAHFSPFDIAWLIASIEPNKIKHVPSCIMNIRWRDTQLLTKWCVNGQKADETNFSTSLRNCVATFLMHVPGAAAFLQMKDTTTLDPNSPYWKERGLLDVIFTAHLAEFMWEQLPKESHRGFIIEQRTLPTIANSWLIGMHVNRDKLKHASDTLHQRVIDLCKELQISQSVLTSPKQLGNLLFNTWKLPVGKRTPTGAPSTASDVIKILAYEQNIPQLKKLVEAKEATTLISKYVKTAYEALDRTGEDCMYAVPRVFGTLTGRLTYSNSTLDTWKVSIAAHQIPRKDKIIRSYIEPPPGLKVAEADANAQESRIMAIWSRDENMLNVFRNGMNFHSFMAARIYGRSYDEFQASYVANDGPTNEQRQNGKLLNLSSNFRIGAANFAHKSFTEYDKYMTFDEAAMLLRMFKLTYPGVPVYWDKIIEFAKQFGYTYTIAGRRYKVYRWSGDKAWQTEGTVISHPIQGTGGEQFHAALSQVREARLITTLHDASFFAVENDEEAKDIEHRMNATPYADLWNVEIPIPLPYDAKIGNNFSEVK